MERSNSRHHPLCPDCGYDLLGSVDARRRVCPECGYEFTLVELSQRGRKGDWTRAPGHRRAVTALLVKSLASLPVCTVLLWLVTPALASPPYWGVVLVLAVAGFVLGFALCVNLAAYAGCVGPWLAVLAMGSAWAIVGAAAGISHWFRPLPGLMALYAQMTVGAFASLWIVKAIILDDRA